MYNESLYNVVADYEKYAQEQKAQGLEYVSLFKYVMGNF